MMKVECRRLEANEVELVAKLLATEGESREQVLWQDRRPNPSAIFAPILEGEAIYFGAFIGSEIVGCSAIYPLTLSGGTKAWLDTDLFVTPRHRGGPAGFELVHFRYQENLIAGPRLYFCIEENPRQLNINIRVARRHGMRFLCVGETVLRHEYMTNASSAHGTNSDVVIRRVMDLTPHEIEQWFLSELNPAPLMPRIDIATIQRLARLDPDAAAFRHVSGVAAVLLSQARGRRFLCTGRPNLILTKLGRATGEILGQNTELRLGVLGLVTKPAEVQKLAGALDHLVRARRFHALVYRDLDLPHDQFILSDDAAEFRRRVFVNQQSAVANDPELNFVQRINSARLDSVFL